MPGIGDAPHGFPRVLMGAERRKAEIAFTARAEPHAGSPHYAETVKSASKKRHESMPSGVFSQMYGAFTPP